jgi:hypothetical protein
VTKRGRRQKSVGVWRRVGEEGGIAYPRRKWTKQDKERGRSLQVSWKKAEGIGIKR